MTSRPLPGSKPTLSLLTFFITAGKAKSDVNCSKQSPNLISCTLFRKRNFVLLLVYFQGFIRCTYAAILYFLLVLSHERIILRCFLCLLLDLPKISGYCDVMLSVCLIITT